MDLTKQAKLGLLFGDLKNQLLLDISSLERGKTLKVLDQEQVTAMTGLQRPTLDNWRRGRPMKPETVEVAITTAEQYLKDVAVHRRRNKEGFEFERINKEIERLSLGLARFRAAFLRADASVYDVAEILGMQITTCQQTLDNIIYRQWPLFPAMYYDMPGDAVREADDVAEQHLARYEGVYLAHVRRGENLWLQAPLRVRYLMECGKGRFIRCKMNFPIIDPGALAAPKNGVSPKYWELDGTLAVRDQNLYWCMEKRQSQRNDYFYFITGIESTTGSNHLTLSGTYLTTGQDARQSIVSGDILLHRLFSDDGKDKLHLAYRDIMWNEVKVFTSKPDIDVADKRWEQYRTRYERDDDDKDQ
ncbi:MAG: hypothetical protein KIT17_01000 [Rubrivivax sp.]|nr:hypothetical protein [Rubrivivax sp.]